MTKSWIIGAEPGCDLVADRPGVSGRHCRLTRVAGGYLLEDLGSTNGTFVNGARIAGATRVARGDAISLGRHASMPWPPEEPPQAATTTVLRLGRDPDNDLVIDLPTVSGRHARFGREPSEDAAWIEDLGSANGTSVGSPGRRPGRQRFTAEDTVYLGSHSVPGAWLLSHLDGRSAPSSRGSATVIEGAPGRTAIDRSVPTRPEHPAIAAVLRWPSASVIAASALLALAIVAAGRLAGAGVATLLAWLAWGAVGFGLATVLVEYLAASRSHQGVGRNERTASIPGRLALVAVAGLAQCGLAWTIVAVGAGLRAPALGAIGLLTMAAAVGLAIGGLIVAVRPSPWAATAAGLVALATIGLIGGTHALGRSAADAMPTRWAFEGLLLLESGRAPRDAGATGPDLAEPNFPVRSGRSGVRACVLALGLMAVGIGATAAFIAWGPGAPRSPGSSSLAPGDRGR